MWNYEEYLNSEHWQKKKLETTAHFYGECLLCGSAEGLEVHHTKEGYKNLWRERMLIDVILLCETCHQREHQINMVVNDLLYETDLSQLVNYGFNRDKKTAYRESTG